MKPYDDSRPKGEQVEAMFDGIAPVYDRLNDIMSFGIARRWRRKVVNACANGKWKIENGKLWALGNLNTHAVNDRPLHILDLATGTGDLAIALARRLPEACITGADPSEGMLAVARRKAAMQIPRSVISKQASVNGRSLAPRFEMTGKSDYYPAGIDFVTAEAERLPFGDGTFDMVTAAFGVRNFHDIPQGLREMHRVITGGGSIFILEFSTPRNRIFGSLYRFYFHRILPRIGALLSKDRRAYTYLPDSVDEFPVPAQFTQMLRDAGFSDVEARSLTGGVAYIYKGVKIN